jgi:hypothetical protein
MTKQTTNELRYIGKMFDRLYLIRRLFAGIVKKLSIWKREVGPSGVSNPSLSGEYRPDRKDLTSNIPRGGMQEQRTVNRHSFEIRSRRIKDAA